MGTWCAESQANKRSMRMQEVGVQIAKKCHEKSQKASNVESPTRYERLESKGQQFHSSTWNDDSQLTA